MNEYLKSGRQALRLLYFLVISFSITNSIKNLFTIDNIFQIPNVERTVLFCIFLSFVTRYFLGAYRVLSEDIEIELKRPKIVIDIIAFFIQALSFYVYSLNFFDFIFTQWAVFIISLVDLVWLASLAYCFDIKPKTFKEWMINNIVFVIVIPINLIYLRNFHIMYILSFVAFIADFVYNLSFYLAHNIKGLRIFVAGPYGDNEPKEIIEENVRRARDIGKELALKGHFPFIPHTMLHGWETDQRFTIQHFKDIDFKWLSFCDALYFISSSKGADIERGIAQEKGIIIYTSLSEVPDVPKIESKRKQ